MTSSYFAQRLSLEKLEPVMKKKQHCDFFILPTWKSLVFQLKHWLFQGLY